MSISIDLNHVKAGDYFIPIKGVNDQMDGYLNYVIEKGAHVLDVDLFSYVKSYRRKLSCKIIALVGSSGKSTMKHMIKNMLLQQFNFVQTQDDEGQLFDSYVATLESGYDTSFLLLEFNLFNKESLAIMTQVIQPDIIIFTGVSNASYDHIGTLYQVASAMTKVFRRKLKWQDDQRVCFLASSSMYLDMVVKKAKQTGYQVIMYSGDDKLSENINGCYQIGAYLNIPLESIEYAIKTSQKPAHSMKLARNAGFMLFDDTYHSSPSQILYAFQYISRFDGRKIAVLGDMDGLGNLSQKEHMGIKDYAQDYGIDMLFLIGSEMAVLADNVKAYYHFSSLDSLVRQLKEEIKDDDIILIKGSKVTSMYKIVEELRDYHVS